MRAASTPNLIDVQALRVGMFIHLDVGWMSHPFPLSSFKITSPQQVATIRALGLKRVRWNPQQSDPAEPDAARAALVEGRAGVAAPPGEADAGAPPSVAVETPEPAPEGAPIGTAPAGTRTVDAAAARRRALGRQRVTLQLCERQFTEASRACKQLTDLVLMKPQEARVQAEALTRALADKMLGQQELYIRLLTEAAGDKCSLHAINVAIVALLMGRAFGFGQDDMVDIGVGALLHDIGKLEIPLRLRHRDESFTPSEQRDYEDHVAQGLAVARRMGLSAGATLVIAQHHEHADGSGFPLKLNTDRMTAAARIVALINRYDNLCNPHFLAKALTPHEALSVLFAQGKTKYDTAILAGFIKMMGVYPLGSTVQLTDDRHAMVVGVNSSRPLKPSVLVHEAGVPREQALVLDLEGVQGLGVRRSIKLMQLPPATLEYLAPRQRVAYFFEPAVAAPACV